MTGSRGVWQIGKRGMGVWGKGAAVSPLAPPQEKVTFRYGVRGGAPSLDLPYRPRTRVAFCLGPAQCPSRSAAEAAVPPRLPPGGGKRERGETKKPLSLAARDGRNGAWAEIAQREELLQEFGSSGLEVGQRLGQETPPCSEDTFILR